MHHILFFQEFRIQNDLNVYIMNIDISCKHLYDIIFYGIISINWNDHTSAKQFHIYLFRNMFRMLTLSFLHCMNHTFVISKSKWTKQRSKLTGWKVRTFWWTSKYRWYSQTQFGDCFPCVLMKASSSTGFLWNWALQNWRLKFYQRLDVSLWMYWFKLRKEPRCRHL